MSYLTVVLHYLLAVARATGIQLLALLGPALLVGLPMHYLSRAIERRAVSVQRVYLLLFGWLGTAIHELGHALFCVIFRHEITEMKLFGWPRKGSREPLGYVRHRYDPKSRYQVIGNLFIGVGPIILAGLLIWAAARLLLDPAVFQPVESVSVDRSSWTSVEGLLRLGEDLGRAGYGVITELTAPERLGDWQSILFLYLAFTIGSSITLSPADLRGAWVGLRALLVFLIVVNLATCWLWETGEGAESRAWALGRPYARVAPVLVFVLCVHVFFAGIVVAAALAVSLVRRIFVPRILR